MWARYKRDGAMERDVPGRLEKEIAPFNNGEGQFSNQGSEQSS